MSLTKIFSVAALSVFAIHSSAQASTYLGTAADLQSNRPANQISIQPLNFLVGEVALDLERKLSDHVTVVVTPFVGTSYGYKPEHKRFEAWKGDSVGGHLSLRIWPAGHAMEGFYVEPYGGYHHMFALNDSSKHSAGSDAALGGARVGWQWLAGKHAVISLAGGAAYRHVWSHANAGTLKVSSNAGTVKPDLRFGVGFAF